MLNPLGLKGGWSGDAPLSWISWILQDFCSFGPFSKREIRWSHCWSGNCLRNCLGRVFLIFPFPFLFFQPLLLLTPSSFVFTLLHFSLWCNNCNNSSNKSRNVWSRNHLWGQNGRVQGEFRVSSTREKRRKEEKERERKLQGSKRRPEIWKKEKQET